jgi:hypothetical protein
MEQAEKNNEVVNETFPDAGAAPSYSTEQEPINADHVSIDDALVDSAESDEDSPVVGADSVEKTDDAPTALEVTASQDSPTTDEISVAVGVAPTTGSADPAAASVEKVDDVLTVESVQTGVLADGAVLVTETGPKFVERPAVGATTADVPKKPKAFSIARVDACVLSMWEHVNAGSHDVIEEIEKLLGIKG